MNFNIFFLGGGGGEWIFLGHEAFVGLSHNWTTLRGHFYVYMGLFLRSMYTQWGYFFKVA